jgi:hypothetical protein
MEKCTHCHTVRNGPDHWRHFVATYHDVEIRHDVCPHCSTRPFPRFYRVQESLSQDYVNGTVTKKFFQSIFRNS